MPATIDVRPRRVALSTMSGELLTVTIECPAGIPSYMHSYAAYIQRLSLNRARISFTPSNFVRCCFQVPEFADLMRDDFTMDDNAFTEMIQAMRNHDDIPLIININFMEK